MKKKNQTTKKTLFRQKKKPTEKPVEKPAEEKKTSTEIKVDDQKSEENKNSESKKEEKNSDTQITVTDANGNEIPVEEKINPQKRNNFSHHPKQRQPNSKTKGRKQNNSRFRSSHK